jgi:AcrR family transcriptional regulator
MEKQTVDPLMVKLFEFRPRKGDLKKASIITAAIECLSEDGLEKTTFEAIAKKIGTRRAHVNYYFADKQKIFLAAIQYIAATYQSISLECLEKAKTDEDLIEAYLEGPFKWAKVHPEQLSVMFLLYYLSTFQNEYLELNHQIRKGGAQRISYVLRKKDSSLSKKEADDKAKSIQNILSGCLLDVATTKGRTLASASREVKRLIRNI